MKVLFANKRYILSIFLITLILFGTYNTGYGQDKGQAAAIEPPLSERTPQIRDAIVAAVPGVNNADDVTAAHLAEITTLKPGAGPGSVSVTSLKSGDFNGLTALTYLNLSGNGDPIGDISVLGDLTTLTTLYLAGRSISDISFLEDLTALKTLYLTHNSITDISVLENLTALTELSLGENSVSDISVLENLTKLETLILDNNSISDISALENLTKLTMLALNNNSISDISVLEDFTALKTLYVKSNPISDYRPLRRLSAAIKAAGGSLPLDITIPPEFTEGTTATRIVAENTAASVNIGTAVAATDADNDTLTYTLGGTDADSFSIVSPSGQLQTSAALDFETKSSYSVTVDVSDGKGGSDAIDVTINVTNVNEAPVFTQGTRATLAVAENTAPGTNIGVAFTATDPDNGDILTYSLRRSDKDSFSIDPNTGQLQTRAALDYETKSSYNKLAVRVTDSSGLTDAIVVTINVTKVNQAPTFTEGASTTRAIAENTASGTNIGTAVAATDVDVNTTLTYTLGGADASSFSIDGTNGQLKTKAALDYETQPSYSVRITVSDTKLTDTIDVRINVTDVDENRAPSFAEGNRATRSVAENTAADTNIGNAVSATDPDNDTLTYTLGGADAAMFSIDSTNGQLQTKAPLDYETQTSYAVTVSVSDGNGGTDSITVTINVTDVSENRAPAFTDGASTTRFIAENTASGVNIGSAVAATDADSGDTLTYSLGGTDASSFSIDSATGQLQTKAPLDYETKNFYSVSVSVSDGNGESASIAVTINITDVDEIDPPLSERTAQVRDAIVSAAGVNSAADVTVAHLAAITSLNFGSSSSNAGITSLKSGDFSGLSSLRALELFNNPLTTLPEDVFDGLSSLVSLGLSGGVYTITTLPEDVFDGLSFLTRLSLHGDFTSLPEDLFDGLSSLKELQLRFGKNITSLPEDLFDGLSSLTSLAIYGGGFTSLPEDLLDGLSSLQKFNSHSSVETLPIDFFDGLPSLTSINLSGSIRMSLPEDLFDGLSSLTSIRISGDFTSISSDIFDGLSSLESLTLSINNNSSPPHISLPSGIFDGLSSLISLDLRWCVLTSLPSDIFDDLSSLTTLDLSNNNITDVSEVEDLTSLTTLNLSRNLISDYGPLRRLVAAIEAIEDHPGLTLDIIIDFTDVGEIDPPLSERTPQVRDAIVRASYVNSADHVTAGHLAAITSLSSRWKEITSLKAGDFGGLTAMTYLDLSGNSISDISVLEDLTRLTELNLSGNSISDISVLEDLTALRELNLSGNSISDISVLEDLTRLRELNLSGNSISDISALEDLTALTKLNLSGSSISDISVLEDLTALTYLDLSGSSISDISALEDLTALTWLYLDNTSISDISMLEDLTALTWLDLSSTSISDISVLEDLTALTWLYLDNTSISDISVLEDLTALRELNLAGNPISDYGPLRRLIAAIDAIEDHPGLTLDIDITSVEARIAFEANTPAGYTRVTLNATGTVWGIPTKYTTDSNVGTVAYMALAKLMDCTFADAEVARQSIVYIKRQSIGRLRGFVSETACKKTSSVWSTHWNAARITHLRFFDETSLPPIKEAVYNANTGTITMNVGAAAPSVETSPIIPDRTALLTNFPNPFNPETWIPYQLAEPADVTLTIYNVRGVVIRQLKLGHKPAGIYQSRSKAAHWDGRNHLGEKVATGVYFYTLKAGDYSATRKLLIRK